MSIAALRPANACLPPVLVDPLLDNPQQIRALARENGPYFQPARYLIDGAAASAASDGRTAADVQIPAGIIGPVFRGDWALGGKAVLREASSLLTLPAFVDAAKSMCGSSEVVPQQVFVNLTAPSGGAPFSHTDIPEFVGVDRSNAPGWLLSAMGASGLFEAERITIITAVSWFYEGERGFFRYWPEGREAQSIRHEDLWNTAVVGDNDFMHHKVERTGAKGAVPPATMTIDSLLDFDGNHWVITDGDNELARYDDVEIRLSLSWKAKVYDSPEAREAAEMGVGGVSIEEVLARFGEALDEPLASETTSPRTPGPEAAPRTPGRETAPRTPGREALSDPRLRDQLSARWTSYVPG